MVKRLFIYSLLVAFIVSCGQKAGEKTVESTIAETTVTEILNNPMEFNGKEVRITGLISHVCKHAGDKMRVMQEESELSVLVMLGDFTGQITPENEGQNVVLEGMITVEVKNLDAIEEEHKHEGEEHEDGHVCASTEEAIAKMKEKGIDPEFRVVIDLKKFELQ